MTLSEDSVVTCETQTFADRLALWPGAALQLPTDSAK
jgi:hypothetical protein